ncbi:MAG: endolytic transglycosylase MltG [Rhodospirillales bacterium]|nr:endolytic transglycosylase MltG [Rhodospirillales bacterium]
MRRLFQVLLAMAVVGGGLVIAVLVWGLNEYTKPGPLAAEKTVIIPKGKGVAAISGLLADAGIIDNPLVFQVGVRFEKAANQLRAGEFAFSPAISIEGVVTLLRSGETVVRRITIPEGLTSHQVIELLNEADGLEGRIDHRVREGTLLPETYHYSYGDSRIDLLARMKTAMDNTVEELWVKRAPDIPLKTPEEAVILASIVEEETSKPGERKRVAAVFYNRMNKGMRLQSDPTVAYGITNGDGPLPRPLTRADLQKPSPYNTYVIDGLPPRPIANPGRKALKAVMNPAKSDDFYFVADGSGGHAFARNLKEHNQNVSRWRKLQKNSDSR